MRTVPAAAMEADREIRTFRERGLGMSESIAELEWRSSLVRRHLKNRHRCDHFDVGNCQSTKSLCDSPLKRGPTRGSGNQMKDRR
jgi:hypothetical protein